MLVKKNHSVRHIVEYLIIIFVLTIFLLLFAGKRALDALVAEINTMHTNSSFATHLIKEKIDTNIQNLSHSASHINNGTVTQSILQDQLYLLDREKSLFDAVGVIDENGNGIYHTGQKINEQDASQLVNALKNILPLEDAWAKNDKTVRIATITNKDGTNVRLYGIAITNYALQEELANANTNAKATKGAQKNAVQKFASQKFAQGWLFAKASNFIPFETGIFNQSEKVPLFLIDANNKIVARTASVAKDFDYQSILQEYFLPTNVHLTLDALLRMSDKTNNIEENDANHEPFLQELRRTVRMIFTIAKNSFNDFQDLTWAKSTIHTNCGDSFSIIIGFESRFSEETVKNILNEYKAFGILYALILLVLLLQIINIDRANAELITLAYVDPISKWNNWNKFELDGTNLLRRHAKKPCNAESYAVVIFDVRKFRLITDIAGEKKSNAILRAIASTLRKETSFAEACGNIYSDEFIMLLRYSTKDALRERLVALEEKLSTVKDFNQKLSFTFGVYCITDYNLTLSKMKDYAGMIKDALKRSNDSSIGFFDDMLLHQMHREKEIENLMEDALMNEAFEVFLQPKFSPTTKTVAGAEALVRWNQNGNMISPGEFIPIFERNLFIFKLDFYMLSKVCKLQKSWLDKGENLVVISVNISRAHLLVPSLVDEIIAIIDKYQVPHEFIEIELTESAFFEDRNILFSTVKRLQDAHIHVSMDDFGSGYSSLNSLKDIPVDVVKLDGAFFKESSDTKERGDAVIKHTIQMAKELNIKIVAEGIETKEQVDFLQKNHCDLIQGFYFARPMPVNQFEKLMAYEQRG